jgi:two-component system sensor histidine kinase UhpB
MKKGRYDAAAPSFRGGLWPVSLRGQIVLIPTTLLFIGLIGMIGIVMLHAHARIATEIASGVQSGSDLVTAELRDVADASSTDVAFEHLEQALPQVRHVQFRLVHSGAAEQERTARTPDESGLRPRPWLARILAPQPVEQVFPVIVKGHSVGEVRLRSQSADEIGEIVDEVELFTAALLILSVLTVTALLWSVERSLRPLRLLAEGFNRLEFGQYEPIASIRLVELRRIGEQFNHLAQSLRRVTADNHRLVDKLLSVQEQERKELAAELHDEFGPTLFGIRAEAASIMRATLREQDGVWDHARTIADLTEAIQKLNYRMLDRLRPLVLEQMGFGAAVRQLVADWQARHPSLAWSLEMEGDFDDCEEASGLALYRILQECITNAVRHAHASGVLIQVKRLSNRDGGNSIFLSVRDDGRGFPDQFPQGFGLLGMAERVRQIGGVLKICNASPAGAVLEILIPAAVETLTRETIGADPAD